MSGDPADIGRAPESILIFKIENPLAGLHNIQEISGCGVNNALGLAGAAAGIEYEKDILCVHRLRLAHRLDIGSSHFLVIPVIAALLHNNFVARALHNEHFLDGRALRHRSIGAGLGGNGLAAAIVAIGGYEHCRITILDSVTQSLGAESAEHDAVDRADPGAGKHRDRQLGDHRQVYADTIALLYAMLLEYVGEFADIGIELLICKDPGLARLAFKYDSGLVLAPGIQVAVDAVVGHIDLAAGEPFELRLLEIGLGYRVPLLDPIQLLGGLSPESIGVIYRFLIDILVLLHALDIGLFAKLLGRLKNPVFFLH